MSLGEDKRPNILLITIDSLRADHICCLGYQRGNTPNIDGIAKEGCLFSETIANGPSTPYSFRSILCSVYPLMGMDRFGYKLPKQAITVAEALKKYGYASAAFHTNPYICKIFGWDRGFDLFKDFFDINIYSDVKSKIKGRIKRLLGGTRNYRLYEEIARIYRQLHSLIYKKYKNLPSSAGAHEINKNALYWLKRHKSGSFLWLHYMETHYSYIHIPSLPNSYKLKIMNILSKFNLPESVSGEDIQNVIKAYDAAIMYVDYKIGELINELKEMDIYDNTYIIITADHGEEFKEHGGFIHLPKLYDELLHVPLIIKGPKIPDGIIIRKQVSLLDIAPTIIDLLSLPKVKKFEGESLYPLMIGYTEKYKRDFVISECFHRGGKPLDAYGMRGEPLIKYGKRRVSIRTAREKLIYDEERGCFEFYDLEEDPNETRNIYMNREKRIRKLKEILKIHIIRGKEMEREIIREKIRKLREK